MAKSDINGETVRCVDASPMAMPGISANDGVGRVVLRGAAIPS